MVNVGFQGPFSPLAGLSMSVKAIRTPTDGRESVGFPITFVNATKETIVLKALEWTLTIGDQEPKLVVNKDFRVVPGTSTLPVAIIGLPGGIGGIGAPGTVGGVPLAAEAPTNGDAAPPADGVPPAQLPKLILAPQATVDPGTAVSVNVIMRKGGRLPFIDRVISSRAEA